MPQIFVFSQLSFLPDTVLKIVLHFSRVFWLCKCKAQKDAQLLKQFC